MTGQDGVRTDTTHRLDVANDPAELRRMTEWLAAIGEREGFAPDVRHALDVSLNEAVLNVISYAWDDDAPHRMSVTLRRDGDDVIASIEDDGRPFDPTAHQPTPLATTLDDAQPGGLGIWMMREFLAELRYERRQGRNHLTLVARPRGAGTD